MASDELDPYSVLGVPRSATPTEIRAAYRALMARYHPDRHQGNPLEDLAVARVAEINRAYEILAEPSRRAAHDAGGEAGSPRGRAAAKRSLGRGLLAGALLLLALPLVLRMGLAAVRGVAALASRLLGGAGGGGRMAALAAAVALVVLLFALRRRGR